MFPNKRSSTWQSATAAAAPTPKFSVSTVRRWMQLGYEFTAASPSSTPPTATATSTTATTTTQTWASTAAQVGQDLAVGGLSAAVTKTLNSPLEVTKMILQNDPGRYTGIRDLLVKLPKDEGVRAFWRGNGANVARYFPTQALNFAFKERYKQALMPLPASEYSFLEHASRQVAAGGAAGATSLVFVHPLEVARTLLTTDKKGASGKRTYTGLGNCLATTYRAGGPAALYKGFGISVVGILPYRAVYFGGYEVLKQLYMGDSNVKPSLVAKWGMSQVNTMCAALLVYPLDTVRRAMMKAGEVVDGVPSRTYKGSMDCFRILLRERGFFGLFRGALANSLRSMGAALCMVMYDEIQDQLKASAE